MTFFSMELTTFVAETLKQIAEGVVQADKDVEPLGATVNPRAAFSNQGLIYVSENNDNNIKTGSQKGIEPKEELRSTNISFS